MPLVIDQTVLRNSVLFQSASDEILNTISRFCQPMELPAGEILFAQDSAADAMYFLEDGQVHIIRHYSDGYEVILATEAPYYVIGELSMLADLPRTGSVVAVSDCDLIKIDRAAILELFHEYPALAINATNHLSQRLYAMNLKVRESGIGNVTARVASALLMMARSEAGPIQGEVSIARLARTTAIDADIVDHLLAEWCTDDLISMENRHITILNIEAIHNLAG